MNRRRQRYTSPDGIDWRDPNMPVLRPWQFPDGSTGVKAIDPEEEQDYCRQIIRRHTDPDWRHDETYNLRKRGRNTKR